MNGNRDMDVQYVDSGFPYAVNESFMNFFEGLSHVPVNYSHPGPVHDQETAHWSMHNMQSYKFGISDPESTYYSSYAGNNYLPRTYETDWAYPSTMNAEEQLTEDVQSVGDDAIDQNSTPEESNINDMNADSSQASSQPEVIWQDNIDPDDMTYEELLDLGEAVGTENRGLSKELISLLPTSKYKLGSIFSKKKSGERCVVCQMSYKRGDKQITLPCKHAYHNNCITKWLSINKACPICNIEVFGEESSH